MLSNARPTHILLIEESSSDIARLRPMLAAAAMQQRRFQLEVATSLTSGLTRLTSGHFDLVLLDCQLADGSGLQPFRLVHAEAPHLPVIILTDTDDETLATEAVGLGAQDYLVKGKIDGRLLARAINHAIERQQLLSRLEQFSEERFQRIIEQNIDAMVIVDRRGIVRYANPATEILFERPNAEIVHQPFYFALSANTTMDVKIPCKGRAAREKVAEIRVSEIEWDKLPALLASIRDITELRRIEQLKAEVSEHERLDRLKDEFVSNASHELRTPLAIIKSAVDNLVDGVGGPITDDHRHFLQIAQRNIDRLSNLVNDMLDLSRLEAGKVQPRRRRIEPSTLIQETVQHLHMIAEEKGVALHAELPPHLPAVDVDPDLITQALTNLLANAVRFAQHRVHISALPLTADTAASSEPTIVKLGGRVFTLPEHGLKISVIDDGPGIPVTALSRLFNRFEQLHQTTPGGHKGTGLGLAITREIIHLHGGAIWAESPAGSGAHFHCVLPLYRG